MVKRVLSIFLCTTMLLATSLAMAGGPPCYPPPAQAPCGPYGVQQGNPCAYWGDAPFPGLCGGVVALPFLVVGSLLGGNTVAPYGPPPAPGYKYAPPPVPIRAIPQPMNTGCAPAPAPACGAPYGQTSFLGGGMLGGLPCLELCGALLGNLTGGMGFGL
jgi:hypothetical protein